MSLSKKLCEEFLNNPSQNPITKRKIEPGKITHKKLMEECRDMLKRDKAPPLGPMMHWDMHQNDRKNLVEFANYIEIRIDELQNEKILSKMEIQELRDILHEVKNEFSNKKNIVAFCEDLLVKIKALIKQKQIIDDMPKHKVIDAEEVFPERVKNRLKVYAVWNRMDNYLTEIDKVIKKRKIYLTISQGTIDYILRAKKYLDYLIAHNIFSYDDIYKKTFKSEKDFDELAEKYKLYKKIYKDVKGEDL